VEVSAAAKAAGSMTIEEALQKVIKTALFNDNILRGARECIQALDARQAHLCIMADDTDEPALKKLIEALCNEHNIRLVRVPEAKSLGEWAGLCKYDRDGKPRKVVSCSVVVIKGLGEETEAMNMILSSFQVPA
jgi:small subunit ribosomal protein S12e